MAIAKTSPAPTMTVGDYKDAALRHFNTCKVLWRYITIPDTSNLKNIDEAIILKNVFYLSGYVVECALKYRYCTNCRNLQDSHSELYWQSLSPPIKMKHFAFTNHPKHSNNPSNDKIWSEQILQQLVASNNGSMPNHLRKLGTATPLILNLAEDILYDMQASWEPSIRYHFETNGLIADKAHIEAFYQSTKNLLRNLSMI